MDNAAIVVRPLEAGPEAGVVAEVAGAVGGAVVPGPQKRLLCSAGDGCGAARDVRLPGPAASGAQWPAARRVIYHWGDMSDGSAWGGLRDTEEGKHVGANNVCVEGGGGQCSSLTLSPGALFRWPSWRPLTDTKWGGGGGGMASVDSGGGREGRPRSMSCTTRPALHLPLCRGGGGRRLMPCGS